MRMVSRRALVALALVLALMLALAMASQAARRAVSVTATRWLPLSGAVAAEPYRIGDVIKFNDVNPYYPPGHSLNQIHLDLYPDSIAAEFVRESRARGFVGQCHATPGLCYPIIETAADKSCPTRLASFASRFGPVPDVVVHVRTADVIDKDGKKVPGEAAGRPIEFYDKLGPLLRGKGITKVTIITSYKHNNTNDGSGSKKYIQFVRDAMTRASVETEVLITDDADMDFCVMLSAPTLVPSRSGLSELAGEVSRRKGHRVIGMWNRNDADAAVLGTYDPTYH
jgi:hypothetical protein